MPEPLDNPYRHIDFRRQPWRYRLGRGEAGVLSAEPYKSELLPLWRFRTPELARASADALFERYLAFKADGDFVGMDLARKYLQMGYTRSRRYANHKGGRKYDAQGHALERALDPTKAESARIFKQKWDEVRADPTYQLLKRNWLKNSPSKS
jgi:hypothetical protein